MKKAFYIIFLILFFAFPSLAQKGSTKKPFKFANAYKSSWGLGSSLYKISDHLEPVPLIDWAPQLDLTRKYSDFSYSLNTQLAAGYHIPGKYDSTQYFYAEIPLFAEINFGHLASKDFFNNYGLFGGAGYTFNYIRDKFYHGPALTAGARFWLFGKSFTLRYNLYSLKGVTDMYQTLTLNINTGEYLEAVKANNKISRFMGTFHKQKL